MPEQKVTKKTTTKKVVAKDPRREPENVTTALTVSGAEHEPANRPESFKALKLPELQAAANAFGSDWEGLNDEAIRANLEADQVTWNMYVRQFKLPGWQELPDEEADPTFLEDWDEADETEEKEDEVETIITRAPVQNLGEGKYLIKFVGQNWYFERGKYTFSKDSPYALMSAKDAQSALVEEPTKFRQAFPAELEEYYDKN